MKRILSILAVALGLSTTSFAQSIPADYTNPILSAMPSLSITPDARSGGMGDLGTATTPDMSNQYWNVAKWAYMEQRGGISASYTPWLRKICGGINLAHLEGWYNISDKAGAVSASFTYFKMGEVDIYPAGIDISSMAGIEGELPGSLGTANPYELAVDLGYSRKLHEYVSLGVALRFMVSDLYNGFNSSTGGSSSEYKLGWTMAADLGLYYNQPIDIAILGSAQTSYFRLGFTLKNLGGKIAYRDDLSSFIPASMNLGVSYELPFDKYNKLTFNVEARRYMVPTVKSRYTEGFDANDPTTWNMSANNQYSNMNAMDGLFKSFTDAPYGSREELKEIGFGAGLEYTYNRQFFARLGYAHEDRMKGNRRLFELGAGFHLSVVNFDVAYTIAAASNPLDQTMRFTIGFDINGIKDLVNNSKK